MPDVVVVGGGVIGCATAFFLSKHGASVTLLERGEIAGEASGAAAGMLAALSDEGGDRGPAFQKLCLDGLALYDEVLPKLAETGIELHYRGDGVLHLALTEAEAQTLRHRYEAQRGLAPDNIWLTSGEVAKEEPAANPRAVGALLSPRERYLDSKNLTVALAEASRRQGVRIETETAVLRVQGPSEGGVLIRTASVNYGAGAVVLAGGPWTERLARGLGAPIPVRPVRGQMLSLLGPRKPLRHVIWGAKAYLVPREDGQTFVGASVEEVGFRKRTTARVMQRLQGAAAGLVPELAGAPLLRQWAGLRPATPDGLPIIGRLPGLSNVWVNTGHFRNGILLGPISGRLLAKSILEGGPLSDLGPFSPDRFVD